jgi:hypothetical protein
MADSVHPHWPYNFLELLLALIFEAKRQPVACMFVNRIRHEYATGTAKASIRAAMLTPSP